MRIRCWKGSGIINSINGKFVSPFARSRYPSPDLGDLTPAQPELPPEQTYVTGHPYQSFRIGNDIAWEGSDSGSVTTEAHHPIWFRIYPSFGTQHGFTIYTYHIYIPLLSSHPSCASILTDIHHDNSYRRYHPRQEAPHRSSRLWPNGPTTRCQCTYCQLNLPHLELTLLVHFLTLLNTYALTKQQLFGLKAPQAHHSSRSRRRRRSFPHRCQMGWGKSPRSRLLLHPGLNLLLA